MSVNKSSVSKAGSYREIGNYWSDHDLSDHWGRTKPVKFTVDIQSEKTYYPLDRDLSGKIDKIAHQRGVSAETLVNLWIKDKIDEQASI